MDVLMNSLNSKEKEILEFVIKNCDTHHKDQIDLIRFIGCVHYVTTIIPSVGDELILAHWLQIKNDSLTCIFVTLSKYCGQEGEKFFYENFSQYTLNWVEPVKWWSNTPKRW